METMNKEPAKTHLRKADIMEWLGCTEWQYRQWIDIGLLNPIPGFGRNHIFLKSAVKKNLRLE